MSEVLLVESVSPKDHAREFLLWISRETERRLADIAVETRAIEQADWDATRRELRGDVQGAVFFAHGETDHLVAHDDDTLFAAGDVEALRGRWSHAFACETAREDGAQPSLADAAAPVASVYAGYKDRIRAAVYFEALHPELQTAIADLSCALTAALARGMRDERGLRAAVTHAWSEMVDALDAHPPAGPFERDSVFRILDLLRTELRLTGIDLVPDRR